MFIITHNSEAIACASSMTQAKSIMAQFRHKPGALSIIHADDAMIGEAMDEGAMLAAERDWKIEEYLQPHHD